MKEQAIARAYARSLIELADEKKVDAAEELTRLQEVINSSNDLENLLFLDIFSAEEKLSVLKVILGKLSISPIVERFVYFLVQEKRLNALPFIYKEVVVIDDHKKGFLRCEVEGRNESLPEEDRAKIHSFLKNWIGREPLLSYKQKDDLVAGYKITAGDIQLDATVDHQFEKLKQNILGD